MTRTVSWSFATFFSKEEVAALQRDAEVLASPQRKHLDANVIEKDGQTLRAAWAPEIDSPACAAAHRLPRVLGPIKQIMGDDIYLYQSRLKYKRAHTGDVFQWHQDYQSWLMDGVPGGGHRDILSGPDHARRHLRQVVWAARVFGRLAQTWCDSTCL